MDNQLDTQVDECRLLLESKMQADGMTTQEFVEEMEKRGWGSAKSERFIKNACRKGLMRKVGEKSTLVRNGFFRQVAAYAFVLPAKGKKKAGK